MNDDAPLVAVVDDEESIRRALLRLLASAHYRAEAFDSAAGFLETLSKRTFECLILDLQMPAMTGLELQQRLHELHVHLPIIVITAYDEPETRARCLALGAERYFCKPVDGHSLIESVQELIESRRGRDRGDVAPPAPLV
ncbi:MAG TPA: response regulator [Gammaproteobacteria bacterium]